MSNSIMQYSLAQSFSLLIFTALMFVCMVVLVLKGVHLDGEMKLEGVVANTWTRLRLCLLRWFWADSFGTGLSITELIFAGILWLHVILMILYALVSSNFDTSVISTTFNISNYSFHSAFLFWCVSFGSLFFTLVLLSLTVMHIVSHKIYGSDYLAGLLGTGETLRAAKKSLHWTPNLLILQLYPSDQHILL